MALAHVIDIDALTAPITESDPQGSDIRADRSPTSDYYTIKDTRNSARAAERSAMFDDEDVDLITPWETVVSTGAKILKDSSKDLEVAAWFTEGLIRLHGMPGLRDGIKLTRRLVEDHWEGLYPEPDEDGLETKVAPLTGLNGDGGDGTLLTPIRNAGITAEGDYGDFSFWQFQQARDADRIEDADAKSERHDTLGFSLEVISNTVAASDTGWCLDMVATIEECIEDFKSYNNLLREHCKHDAPPYTNINNLLDEVLRTARFIYKDKLEAAATAAQQQEEAITAAETTADTETNSANTGSANTMVTTQVISGPICNREDALKQLEEVAKYFRTYEPHTPLAPGLERLINWGRMTVAELMLELLPDAQSRGLYSQLTGVMLDGSDTKSYVAPPAATSPAASSESTAKPAAAPALEPEPEPATGGGGW